jgi:Zn-dependent peptidase ImmA (M78 family)/DNA-binding XRE family transcriptional regulator
MSGFQGPLLKLARESHGWPQVELARRTGVAQGSISKYEKGIQTPSPGHAQTLSEALGFPPSFFEADDARPASVLYRSRSLRSARAEAHVRARLNLARMAAQRLLEDIEFSADVVTRFPDPDSEFASPEAAADQLRSAWWIAPGPVRGLSDFIEAAGGVVARADLGTDAVIAAYMHPLGDPIRWFFINTRVDAGDRVLFSLAHELGHAVLHDSDLVPDTREAESESNQFAGAFLAPARDLRADLPRSRLRLEHLIELKRRWGMSIQALAMRAHQLNVISRDDLSRLYREINARGYGKNEPVHIEAERPQLLAAAIAIHRKHHGYSDEQLATIAKVHPYMLAAIFPEHFQPQGSPRLRVVSGRAGSSQPRSATFGH